MPRWIGIVLCPVLCGLASAQSFQFQPGDHVCIMGNALAERMQHDGWLETLIQARVPRHELVFRNLGFAGDELTQRLRSSGFGSPDEHLRRCQADVVLAFFGYNESFQDTSGLAAFREDLQKFIKHIRGQTYNGNGPPRLVLFSPIAHEDLRNPNLPDGTANNRRLQLYASAMRDVAKAQNVPFVDLWQPTFYAYATAEEPLTINGIHLTERGNRLVAEIIAGALNAPPPAAGNDPATLEAIRRAVKDKNFYWFNRHRTVDGYSIFGGRADLRFVDGQTNREVMDREMAILDQMTANRDLCVHAAAEGRDLVVDDSNLPPFIPVITNKPGELPDGRHAFLSGAESLQKMTVADGMRVNLYASEETFPELINPVQMAWDTRGRLWVGTWPSYPHWKPGDEMDDRLLILEDTDGDGSADSCQTFARGLHSPTGFEFWGGGVIVAMAPDLVFLQDTDGDDAADVRRRILHGLDSADTHHTANSFVLGPGGGLYFQEGTFHHTQVETPWEAPERSANAAVFRYEPRTEKFDVYVSFGFANPHGHVCDRWGRDFVHDGTGAVPYDAALFSGHVEFPAKHAQPPTLYPQRTRPCPATEILSSNHFPAQNQGNLLVANVIGFQGILQYRLEEDGSSLVGYEVEPILHSSDPSFRPVDLEMGPDGALYFTDWQNPVIGHMQHNLRDPSRDQTHGRVYRVTYPSRPLCEPAEIAGAPISQLVRLLSDPADRVRYRARIELTARDATAVLAAAGDWLATRDPRDSNFEHERLEVLWLHQSHNVVNVELLSDVLAAPEHRARAAATRVLCAWRDRLPTALPRLKEMAADEHPRVRLEAVRAASFFTAPDAVEVVLIAQECGSDKYLDFVAAETMKTLDPYWKKALKERQDIAMTTAAGRSFLLRHTTTERLLEMPPSPAVCGELLVRPGLRDEDRLAVITRYARFEDRTILRVLLDAIEDVEQQGADQGTLFDLVRLLANRPADELSAARRELETMATSARVPLLRQIGFVALIGVDGSTRQAWQLAETSPTALRDLVTAMPLIQDPAVRAELYPQVAALLDGLPTTLAGQEDASQGTCGRYVRIELPRRGTLTLAEVEVISDGVNMALHGQASQINTAHGGTADRAIDGNTSGRYSAGGQTHTEEDTSQPWWEVDLQAEYPIESVSVFNRTEGDLGQRLDGFTLEILDGDRRQVLVRQQLPAPPVTAQYETEGGGSERLIRRAAMMALSTVRGRENETFRKLAAFIQEGTDRVAAIRAAQRIPQRFWTADLARPTLESLIAWIGSLPPTQRTTPAALDALQLADALASLLPAAEAAAARAQLRDVGVRVVRIGTLPHRMAYDQERLVVEAGKRVEILFENSDIMPHNFVIARPGSLQEVGLLAEATATEPGALQRHYVPATDQILLSSRLLQPRDQQKLAWQAPTEPAVYPYVCTYPGHWRRMHGALYVVEDLDAYLAAPEAYLAAHPLPIADELLKFNRPRQEWQFDELAGLLQPLAHGRSFGNGKQMFEVASCVSCHRLNNVGNQFGPALPELDTKFTPVDILRELLDPSARINEKYHTYVFELNSGKSISGLVVAENDEELQVIENPLASAQPTVIRRRDIEQRVKSQVSLMPKGLLDKLTQEEILDLIAYVFARGDAEHELFQGGHVHGTGGHHETLLDHGATQQHRDE